MADSLVNYQAASVTGTWGVSANPTLGFAIESDTPLFFGQGSPGIVDVISPPASTAWLEKQDFFFDYYFRIWLLPSGSLDVGGISSAQDIAIKVWNAYPYDEKTLASVDILGIDDNILTTPGDPPLVFKPLELKDYTLTLSSNGTPVIDVLMTWSFTGEPAESLEVTGFRSKTWALPIDWRNPPLERYEWMTDVQESRSGFEQRIQLRQAPRRTIEATFVATGEDLGWFDALLFSWGAKGFLIPIWYDYTTLTADLLSGTDRVYCDTTDRDFVEGGFTLIGDDLRTATAMQISAVYSDGLLLKRPISLDRLAGSAIWPARACQVTSPAQQTQHTAGVVEMRVSFEISDQDEIPASPSNTTFGNYQVLTRDHNWRYTISRAYARKLDILDNSTGVPEWIDLSSWSQITRQLKIMLQDSANRKDFIGWLSSVSGRLTPFWREDRETMLTVTSNQPTGVTGLLYIKPIGFPTLLFGQPGRMALCLRKQDGTVLYRNIQNAQTDATTGDEVLTLDSNIPASVPSDYKLVTYLEFVRLDADAIEIAHQSSEVSEVQFSIRGVKQ